MGYTVQCKLHVALEKNIRMDDYLGNTISFSFSLLQLLCNYSDPLISKLLHIHFPKQTVVLDFRAKLLKV